MATIHALTRASERVGAVLDPETVDSIVGTADALAAKCGPFESVAVRMRTLTMVGVAWSAESNGDTLVAIIRARQVQTFMFRRRTQPFRPENLNVDRCIIL